MSTKAYLWNPTSPNALTPVHNMMADMFCVGQTQLADGRVLAVGGHILDNVGTLNTSIFNPVTNTWSRGEYLNLPRWYPTTTLMPDGKVFMFSGTSSIPEVYDPVANTWTRLPSATLAHSYYPRTFVAPNGKLFVASNGSNTFTRYINPASWAWESSIPKGLAGLRYGCSVMYEAGKILNIGGKPQVSGVPEVDQFVTNACDMIDLNLPTPTWVSRIAGSSVPPMNRARWQANATVLPDGKVFCAGGTNRRLDSATSQRAGDTDWYDAEMFTPGTDANGQPTGTWTTLPGTATRPRWYHTVQLLLPDGSVFTAGSNNTPGLHDQENAQIYYPPYFDLISAIQPQPTLVAPAFAAYGSTFQVRRDNSFQNVATKAALVKLGSSTHSTDMDQRLVWLNYNPQQSRVQAPVNANIAPPGYYMLFLLDRRGGNDTLVPSKSVMVRIGQNTTSPIRRD